MWCMCKGEEIMKDTTIYLKKLETINNLEISKVVKEQLIEDVKAIKILCEKHLEFADVYGYENYESYRINYYDYEYEQNNDYPDWYLTREEFEIIKRVSKRNYY